MVDTACVFEIMKCWKYLSSVHLVFITWICIWPTLYHDVQCQSFWVSDAGHGQNYDYIINNTTSTWFDASGRCEYIGMHLLVKTVTNIPDSGPYWLGAVRYPSWTWTRDDTHLYKRVGYTANVAGHAKTFFLQNNSAYTCHVYCYNTFNNNSYYRYYGLKGIYCTCLASDTINVFNRTDVIRSTEIRCPGNYDEWCGDNEVITVYESERTNFRPIRNGKCAYAIKYANETVFNATQSCDTGRSYACETNGTDAGATRTDADGCYRNVCVRHSKLSWRNAANQCQLLTVTESNRNNFTAAMQPYNQTDSSYYSYWIDLRSKRKGKWINGEDVVDEVDGDNNYDMKCLTVQKTNGRIRLQWKRCSEKYTSLCQISINNTTVMSTITNSYSPNTDQGSTEVNTRTTNPGQNTAWTEAQVAGVAVGSAIALLLLTSVIIGIVYIRKKNTYIKDNSDPNNFTKFKSPSEKNTNGRPKSENMYTNRTFEEGYETIDVVEQSSHPHNMYSNDAGLSNEVDYDILSDSEAKVKSINPYAKLSPDSEGYNDADYDTTTRQITKVRDTETVDNYSRIKKLNPGGSAAGDSMAASSKSVYFTLESNTPVPGDTTTSADGVMPAATHEETSKGEQSSGKTTEADTVKDEKCGKESRSTAIDL